MNRAAVFLFVTLWPLGFSVVAADLVPQADRTVVEALTHIPVGSRVRVLQHVHGKCVGVFELEKTKSGSELKPGFVLQGTKMGPTYDAIGSLVWSPDRKRLAYSARRGNRWHVVLDGTPGPGYEWVNWLAFSPDGRRFVYGATKDGKRHLVIDGKAQTLFDDVSFPVFSLDGRRLAYHVRKGKRSAIVLDGKAGSYHAQVTPPRFSKQGALVYGVINPSRGFIVQAGKPGPPFDEMNWVLLSPPGSILAYKVRTADRWHVVIDGKPGPGFERVDEAVFPDAGSRVAYVGHRDGKQFMVIDGQSGPAWEEVNSPVFSKRGSHVAHVVRQNRRERLVLDGKAGPWRDRIRPMLFAADGTHHVHEVSDDGDWFVMHDGQSGPDFDGVAWPTFSPDGNRLAYWARTGKRVVAVVDARKQHGFSGWWPLGNPDGQAMGGPRFVFSADNKRVAYVGVDQKGFGVVVDGQRQTSFDSARMPMFSPDSKHVAYAANRGGDWKSGEQRKRTRPTGGKWFMVLDGSSGPPFDTVLCPAFSTDSKTLSYIGIRGQQFFVVRQRP